jgi:hypothetical protein
MLGLGKERAQSCLRALPGGCVVEALGRRGAGVTYELDWVGGCACVRPSVGSSRRCASHIAGRWRCGYRGRRRTRSGVEIRPEMVDTVMVGSRIKENTVYRMRSREGAGRKMSKAHN